jgi:hypothetical protein
VKEAVLDLEMHGSAGRAVCLRWDSYGCCSGEENRDCPSYPSIN